MTTRDRCSWRANLVGVAALVSITAFGLPLPAHAGFLEFVESQKDGVGGVEGLAGVLALAVSSDGRSLYAAGGSSDAVAAFERDATTGALTFLGVQKDGVNGVDGLSFPSSLALSPDDKHLYVTGTGDDAVAVFGRDATTGGLSFIEASKQGIGGVDGILGARAVAISSDGAHVYAAGQGGSAIAVFRRDAMTGGLTFVEVVQEGMDRVEGISGPLALTLSPDGANLYVASGGDYAVTAFRRRASDGHLSFVGADKEGAGARFGISATHSVAVSPDGAHVYVTGPADHAVATFQRNKRSGALTFTSLISQEDGTVEGLRGALWVTVSPDGLVVYVASTHSNAVAVLEREERSGALSYVESHTGGQNNECLAFARAVTVSPDGANVYVAGASSNAIGVFRVAAQ